MGQILGKIQAYSDPYYLGSSDSSNAPLGSIIFNGSNYLNWSRNIKMALGAKNKLGFIDGTLKKPAAGTEEFSKWTRNDYMVRCWPFASITPHITDQMMLSESAKGFWDDLAERYGTTNAPQFYMIKELSGVVQGNMSVSEYYGRLKKLWDELNTLDALPECECGAMSKCTCNILRKIVDREAKAKVIDFLMALSPIFDNMKGNVLAMEPLPTINKVFQMVQQVEKQKEVSENPPKPKKSGGFVASASRDKVDSKEKGDPLEEGQKENPMVNTVVEQVLRALSTKQNDGGMSSSNSAFASNFAGKEGRKKQISKMIEDTISDYLQTQTGRIKLSFEELYIVILIVYNDINKCLPGPHYDPPSKDDVRALMQKYDMNLDGELEHEEFVKFMEELTANAFITISQGLIISFLVAPTVALATKRVTEGVPGVGKVVQKLPNSIYASLLTLAVVSFQNANH